MTAEEIAHRVAEVAFDRVYKKVYQKLVDQLVTQKAGDTLQIKFTLEIGGDFIKTEGGYEPFDGTS